MRIQKSLVRPFIFKTAVRAGEHPPAHLVFAIKQGGHKVNALHMSISKNFQGLPCTHLILLYRKRGEDVMGEISWIDSICISSFVFQVSNSVYCRSYNLIFLQKSCHHMGKNLHPGSCPSPWLQIGKFTACLLLKKKK